MTKRIAILCGILAFAGLALGQDFLSQDVYSLTTNSASRTITVTNWPGSSLAPYEWYPYSIVLNNRSASTGEVLKVDWLLTGVTSIHNTNGAYTVTNNLLTHQTESGVSTNWIPAARWYVVPPNGRLRINTSCTNGEIILTREVMR